MRRILPILLVLSMLTACGIAGADRFNKHRHGPPTTTTTSSTTTTTTTTSTTTTTVPPTTTTTTVPPTTTTTTQPNCTAGFGQPCLTAPVGYTSANLLMDDRFAGTSLNTSHWSTHMGGPCPDVGPWNSYPNQPVVDNGLTLSGAMVNTCDPTTGKTLFAFPAGGFYLQVSFKVTPTTNGFYPAIWFPYDNGIHPNAWEMDTYEGGMLGGVCNTSNVDSCVETNYGGSGNTDTQWDQVFATAGENVTQNFVTIGYEWVPGNHVNTYLGQGANRKLVMSDTNAANIGAFSNYNLVITPQGAPCSGTGTNGWHTCGTGTGSIFVSEVQVYSLP